MASGAGTDAERREMGLRRAGPAAQLGSSHGKGCMQGATRFDFCCRNNSWVWGFFYVKLTFPWGVNANQWSSGLRPGPFRGRPVTHTLCAPAPWGPTDMPQGHPWKEGLGHRITTAQSRWEGVGVLVLSALRLGFLPPPRRVHTDELSRWLIADKL